MTRLAAVAMALALTATLAAQNNNPASAKKKERSRAEASPIASGELTENCASPQYPGAATAIDQQCGNDGADGAEKAQNDAKNNFCPATVQAQPMEIADLQKLQQKVQKNKSIPFGNPDEHPLSKQAGPAVNRAPLQQLGEGNLVVLQGYVNKARQEGDESVNCEKEFDNLSDAEKDAHHDIHISLVASPGVGECAGIVSEMIPHHRPAEWTYERVNAVAEAKLKVQVTGQLMFDSSHTPCVRGEAVKDDPERVSLWEVHPIYQFQVCPSGSCAAGGWVPLASWTPPSHQERR